MKQFLMLFLSIVIVVSSYAQSDNILMTVGGKQITKGEFEYLFNKNNDAKEVSMKDVNEYLKLYKNFKLKVIEAEQRGLDTTSAFVNELAGYREQLAKPYLTDREVDDFYMNEAYERLKSEVEASHILIDIKEPKAPADTLEAYNKCLDIIKKIENGADFSVMAKTYSADPSAINNGGYLGYFKGFQMVYPFESGAFATPVGQLSKPVRTSFGYHIIKVLNKRPSPGEVKVAHIMKAVNEESSQEEKNKAREEIQNIYNALIDGKDFNKIAKEQSDDYSTAQNGGELNWFSTGQMVKPFENAAFSIAKVGEISEPIQTSFGWHIIKLEDKRDVQPFEELKEKIKSRLLRDPRGTKAHSSFINKLEKAYNITTYKENIDTFIHLSQLYAYRDTMFKAVTRAMNKTVLTINGVDFSQKHFADYLLSDPSGEVPSEQERVKRKWAKYYDKTIVDYESSVLEEKYPDFRYLMQEYHDGILLFEVSSKEVWNKASEDTVGLEKFYAKNKKNYRWDKPHFSGSIVYCINDSVAEIAKKLVAENKSSQEILLTLNEKRRNIDFVDGIYAKGDNAVVDFYYWGGKAYEPKNEFSTAFLDGELYEEKDIKKLDDCRGAVTSDYQNYLEKNWVKALSKKYKTKVNKSVLKSIVSEK